MESDHRTLPLRWVLPVIQLLICLVCLWPSRYFLLFELSQSIKSYVPVRNSGTGTNNSVEIEIPVLTPEQQQEADRTAKIEFLRMRVPVMLNFPVAIAQLPYVLANPAKREWTPRTMLPETWRAISWPLAGILFWWCAGRGIEAMRSARKAAIYPRMTLIETAFAAVLVCIGLATLVGIITSTPDDRRDVQFLALIAGGSIWGILASFTVIARILQWRILKRAAVEPLLT